MEFLTHWGYFAIALLLALTVHEAAHAWVAHKLGDPTAKLQGRVSLNPMRHLDMMGTLVFLISGLIGWGKPVPVNPGNFKYPIRDSAFTALAGPVSNFLLALLVAIPMKHIGSHLLLEYIFQISVFLGVFNLLPFPPLDGSKILGLVWPRQYFDYYANYMRKGGNYFIVILLVDIIVMRDLFDYSIFLTVVGKMYDWVSLVLFLGT